jgi:unsaturated rhamnogalacturonyl hydrolase
MGWYAMALVDVLDYFPKNHPRRAELVAIFNREAEAIAKYQDRKSGVWYNIIDLPDRKPNYLESSCSAMFVYALAKGVRQGNLPEKYLETAKKGWDGIKRIFIKELSDGSLDWEGTVSVSGLGGNPYRDGSFEYYMSEKLRTNDVKGLGPAVMAAVEMENLARGRIGAGKTVVLDDYFNHEVRPDGTVWHYKWEEKNNGGFYAFGEHFKSYGANLEMLADAPTTANLKNASIYIIVDPDTEKETPKPNLISEKDAEIIADWVKSGGVLVLLGNDYGNAEFENWNNLARKFGIEFNKNNKNLVKNDQFEQGRVNIPAGNLIFKNAQNIFLKEISTLKLSGKAKSVLDRDGETIMAVSRHGKGTVFALGDPWLYNEYVDGRRLNGAFDNNEAARELSRWLLERTKEKE